MEDSKGDWNVTAVIKVHMVVTSVLLEDILSLTDLDKASSYGGQPLTSSWQGIEAIGANEFW